ncbi:MAG: DUF1801 domain-containing protein [Coriobacteriia bacterium]|nr:DUF1801 domain-containing protein [Coriobacteriia bacterium]
MPNPSELIDAMIAKTPDWRGTTLAELRRIIHDADPEISEEVKWIRPSNPMGAPVFEHNGIVCIANILKERVRLSFPAGLSLPDPQKVLSAVSEGNKTRILDLYEHDSINEDALKDVIRAAMRRNLAKPSAGRRER